MFKIIGADGQQYGPVSVEQLRAWIAEGRANAQTSAQKIGDADWRPLRTFSEFSSLLGPQPAPPPIQPMTMQPVAAHPLRTNSFALAGLIMGLISISFGLCCYGFPFNVLGLIFSLIGLSQVNQSPHIYTGKGMAVAGLVLSLLSLAFLVIMLLTGMLLGPHHFRRGFHFRIL